MDEFNAEKYDNAEDLCRDLCSYLERMPLDTQELADALTF